MESEVPMEEEKLEIEKVFCGKALEKLWRVILPSCDKKNQCHVKV